MAVNGTAIGDDHVTRSTPAQVNKAPAADHPPHGPLSVCIYNPDLDPGHDGASNIISYLTQAITTADRR